jgi:tetraacyldisaccharide 4'-kinase
MKKNLPRRNRLAMFFQGEGGQCRSRSRVWPWPKGHLRFGQWWNLLLFPLVCVSWIYGVVIWVRQIFYRRGLFKTRQLPCKVISVGNITLGGTGKTPLVIALAKELLKRGITVGILSRGYKGERERLGGVVSDGTRIRMTPTEAGDEPFMMARQLSGVPVVVGKKRYAMGIDAHERFGMDCLILDDGFQLLAIKRDLDIVLVDARRRFGNGRLFPRGPLREPLRCLRRASMLVLTKAESSPTQAMLEATVRHHAPTASLYHSRYKPAFLLEAATGKRVSLQSVFGRRVFAFAGIADPVYFVYLLRELGADVVRENYFPDHYNYQLADLSMLREQGKTVDLVITTEKDFVKLQRLPLQDIPLYILGIEQEIIEAEFYQELISAISP